ncbi:MAG: hypothetical protein ACLQDF_03070 [Desulfomonilia bacterium]
MKQYDKGVEGEAVRVKLSGNRIIPLLFALFGVFDFIYGIYRHDMISLGMGALMVVISLYIFKKTGASA